MTRAISLHHVSKAYTRGIRVVEGLSLDIAPGEFLVLLGPSGCGKSTVLRMIAGLEEITEGELLLDGEYANDLPPSEREMAMVFQNFALYPNMTNRANIGFPLRIEAPGQEGPPTGRGPTSRRAACGDASARAVPLGHVHVPAPGVRRR